MLFCLGWVFNFLWGGISGVFLSDVPSDVTTHGSFFSMAHFHYTIMGGLVFTFFAAIYYWGPKMTGFKLNERLGKIHFWTLFIFFNSTFAPLFALGFLGQPRRVVTYPLHLQGLNDWVSISAFMIGLSMLVFLYNVIWTQLFKREPAESNPCVRTRREPSILFLSAPAADRFTRVWYRSRWRRCAGISVYRPLRRRTRCATASRHICLAPAAICARSKSCWDMPACRRRSAILRSTPNVCWRSMTTRIRGPGTQVKLLRSIRLRLPPYRRPHASGGPGPLPNARKLDPPAFRGMTVLRDGARSGGGQLAHKGEKIGSRFERKESDRYRRLARYWPSDL